MIPPTAPGRMTRLCEALAPRNAHVIVDTSGEALAYLAEGTSPAPAVLRMDHVEAEELAGRPLVTRLESAQFAAELVARGAAERVVELSQVRRREGRPVHEHGRRNGV